MTVFWPRGSAFPTARGIAFDAHSGERRRLMPEPLRLPYLTPPDREVLVMRYLEDLTFPEIAAILEVGESAAKMRHLRAIERIRTWLKADDSELRVVFLMPEPGTGTRELLSTLHVEQGH